jgi:hypothetical protein
MTGAQVHAIEGCLRLKNRILGIGWHPDPHRHFGPGGVEEAERLCAEANADLPAFLRPPDELRAENLERSEPLRRRRHTLETVRFDSPLPSGNPENDRMAFRLYRPTASTSRKVVVFHHAMWSERWALWEWFLTGLIERVPVAMMAGPYHLERKPSGDYGGESVCSPNPYRLFEAIRQWCWDQRALQSALTARFDLEPVGIIGYSIGAFNTLLATSGGILDLPVVSIASTNRYSYGVFHGVIGHGIKSGMLRVGIDESRLERMTEMLQLDRWVQNLADHDVLYIEGIHDRVDPPPSLRRLKEALNPSRVVQLPAGHATIFLHRRKVNEEILRFLKDTSPDRDHRTSSE